MSGSSLAVAGSGTAGGDGAIQDGADPAIEATVFDYTNSNPLSVRLTDTNGDYVGAGAGTQYTEDVAAPADPVGSNLNMVRADALAAITTTDGDNVSARGTNKGELYVKHVDAIPASQSGTWNVNNVSGTVSLPTGAATLAEQQTQTASLSVMDDWDESDRAKVNPIVGQAGVQGGSGAVSNTTQRVVLATDIALPAGTNAIGKLASNSGVTIGAVEIAAAQTLATVTTVSTLTNITNEGQLVDNAQFTDGTTRLNMAGYIYDEVAGTALTENDGAAARINVNRAQVGIIEDGATRARYATVTASNALKVDNSGVTQPVSGSLTTVSTVTAVTDITNWGNIVDNAQFTDGTTRLLPAAFIYDEVAGTALTENDAAAARVNVNRAQVGIIEDGVTRARYATVTASNALKVDASGVAVPVTDNSGSLTVDAPVGTPVFVRLSDGSAAITNLATNIVQIAGNAVSTAASGVLKIGITGNANATVDSTVGAGTAPTNQIVVGSVYNSSAIAPTTGQAMAQQADQAGNLRTALGIANAALSAWNSSTALNATQNIFTYSGTPAALVHLVQTSTISAGAITFEVTYDNTNWVTIPSDCVIDPSSATLATISLPYTLVASTNKPFLLLCKGAQGLRIKLSTQITGTATVTPNYSLLNYPAVERAVLGAGTATIGALTANQSVNIAQVNGTTTASGNGATDAGTQRVTLSNDSTGLIATVTNLTNVTNWGNIVDNAGFTDGTTRLSMSGYIYDETAGTALTENDAAAARINVNRATVGCIEDGATRARYATVNKNGGLHIMPFVTPPSISTAAVQLSGTTSQQVIAAPSAGIRIVILSLTAANFDTTTSDDILFKSNTTTIHYTYNLAKTTMHFTFPGGLPCATAVAFNADPTAHGNWFICATYYLYTD